MKKQIQFELWQECNSHCKFCYLGDSNLCTPKKIKLNSIENTIKKLDDPSILDEYDTIGYIGGEFFQGQLNDKDVKDKFMQLMDKTASLLLDNTIRYVWIYATMTIGDQKDLYETLEKFGDCDGVWLLTSYDTIGRFHSSKMEDNWKFHMKNIQNKYPKIRFNVTTILTQDLINKYLNNEFSFKDFCKEFKCEFFFKQCGLYKGMTKEQVIKDFPLFLPKRNSFLEFLKKFKEEESYAAWDKLFNIKYRADALYRNFNTEDESMVLNIRYKDQKAEIKIPKHEDAKEMVLSKCGHAKTYSTYADCDKCMLCDKEYIGTVKV